MAQTNFTKDEFTNLNKGLKPDGTTVIPVDTLNQPAIPITLPTQATPSTDINSYLASLTAPPSTADAYTSALNDTGMQEKQNIVNQYTGNINKIVADAEALKLQQRGRMTDVGRISGAEKAIDRETAIKTLPLSAQLSFAQGDLTTATNNVNTLFKLKSEDALVKYNYEKEVRQAVREQMSEKEKRISDAQQKEKDNQFKIEQDERNFEQQKELAKYTQDLKAQEVTPIVQGAQITLTGKPQNAAQSSANGYADRLNSSNIIIDSIGGNFTGKLDIGGSLPNIFQSAERQSYEQAKRNFITAVLRRESGAAISPSEFKTEALKYFPQAGDKPETVVQKSNARNIAINNIYREANVSRPVLPGQIIESGGKKYRVASDGETLEQI